MTAEQRPDSVGGLIARLEAASVGSVYLDSEVAISLDGAVQTINGWRYNAEGRGLHVEPFTTSLDAALALAERVLPESEIWVGRIDGQWEADCEPKGCERHARFVDHKGATPALALCIAVLKARTAAEADSVGTERGARSEPKPLPNKAKGAGE